LTEPSTNNKAHNLLLGVGSQRAGSTLLYRLLHQSVKGLFMHPVKELHVFDSLHHLRPRQALKTFSRHQLERLRQQHGDLATAQTTGSKRLICEIRTNTILSERDINNVDYLDLFRPCLIHHHWVGEVTPEYMLLNEEQLKGVRDQFPGRIVPVLMVRNPAKRFLSAYKLRHFYMRPAGQPMPDNDTLLSNLNLLLDQHEEDGWFKAQLRFNQYSEAQQRLKSVFGDDTITLSLDRLIQNPEYAFQILEERINLEINRERGIELLQQKINETDIKMSLDAEAIEKLNTYFAKSTEEAEQLCEHSLNL
jgi:hypothetical protein